MFPTNATTKKKKRQITHKYLEVEKEHEKPKKKKRNGSEGR